MAATHCHDTPCIFQQAWATSQQPGTKTTCQAGQDDITLAAEAVDVFEKSDTPCTDGIDVGEKICNSCLPENLSVDAPSNVSDEVQVSKTVFEVELTSPTMSEVEDASLLSTSDWESRWRQPKAPPQSVATVSSGPPHLDASSVELENRFAHERQRLAASISSQLRDYDESQSFRNSQERFHNCRDAFEMELRGKASKEMHEIICDAYCEIDTRKRKSCFNGDFDFAPKSSEPPIVIIALMAVHVKTQGRLRKLSHTLHSIQMQDLSSVNAEFHVAVSWYSPEPVLAAKVQNAFHYFIAARGNEMPRHVPVMSRVRNSGRTNFSQFAASVETKKKAAALNKEMSPTCAGALGQPL